MNIDDVADILLESPSEFTLSLYVWGHIIESLAEGEISGDMSQEWDGWLRKWYSLVDGSVDPGAEEISVTLDADLPDTGHFVLVDDSDLIHILLNVARRFDDSLGGLTRQFRAEIMEWHDRLADEAGITDIGQTAKGRKDSPYVSDTPVSQSLDTPVT